MQAVEGRSVELPCNVTPPGYDKVYMVFWFRDDAGIPLYSFDVRGKSLSQAIHWSAPEVFGPRAYFRTVSEPAQLVLDDVRLRDEGVYRCRVDFRNTPTRSVRYNLTVIVLPEQPQVLDRWGRRLNATLGPLLEGDDVLMTCRVVGGKPEPSVKWLLNGEVIDAECEQNVGDVIENRLAYRAVGRHDLGARFTCQASNTALAEPREAALTLDLHLSPLEVRLLESPAVLVADRRYVVVCESTGSRPPAVITWYKGKRQLKRVKEEPKDNVTTSELSFVPTTEDDGKVVTCRAENANITGAYLETSWTISVVFPPIVSLHLGSTLNADDIKEGDDVYFECHVKANPPWRKLSWLHDDVLLTHNMSARVICSNQSLVLQKVTRQSAGRYVCLASNDQGEAASNDLAFRVKYAPTCHQDRILVVGASRGESLDISCNVDTDPPAHSFKWKFNNSGETMEVGSERFSSNGSTSVLRYTVQSDLDYGTLSCWAENSVGAQLAPCVFQVVAAGKPFPVRNCSLSNQTASSVEVSCQPGFDGGLPQHFVLELNSMVGHRYNLTCADAPIFLLADLEPDVTFRAAVYAVNAKGRSPAVLIEELTFRDAERRTASDGTVALPPLLGAVAGAALSFLAVAFLVALKLRRSRNRHAAHNKLSPPQHAAPAPKTLPHGHHAISGPPLDEKDPDVIPAKFEPVTSVGNGNLILREISPPCSYPPPPSTAAPTHWVTQAGSAVSTTPSVYSWELRLGAQGMAAPNADLELNGTAIKERLMASRLPESCV